MFQIAEKFLQERKKKNIDTIITVCSLNSTQQQQKKSVAIMGWPINKEETNKVMTSVNSTSNGICKASTPWKNTVWLTN